MVILGLAWLPLIINTVFFLFFRKRFVSDSKKNVFTHFLLIISADILLSVIIVLFQKLYPIEIKYNLYVSVAGLSIVFLLAETVSFILYCLQASDDSSEKSKFANIWLAVSKGYVFPKTKPDLKKGRFLLLPVGGFFYMILLFGITETFYANIDEWVFSLKNILFPGLVAFLLLTGLVWLSVILFFRNQTIDRVLIGATSVFAMAYIQNAFLNTDKLIDGGLERTPVWLLFLNILLWIAVITIPQILYSVYGKKRKLITNIALGLSGLLFFIQLAPLPYLLLTCLQHETNKANMTDYRFSGEEQYTVSSEQNTIIFVMDAFWARYLDGYFEDYPRFKETFKDFVVYDNVSTKSFSTPISMPYFLTASEVDFSIDYRESNKRAWNSENAVYFYRTVQENGYNVYLYSDSEDYCGGAENMLGKIQNVVNIEYDIETNSLKTYLYMVKLSMYKYSPFSLKEVFYVPGADVINNCSTFRYGGMEKSDSEFAETNADAAKGLGIDYFNFDYYFSLKKGLQVRDGSKRIIFQHLHGMHAPLYGYSKEESVDPNDEVEICFEILSEYIRQLKELGLYDSSCIIFTADHGLNSIEHSEPVMLIKEPYAETEEMRFNSAPGELQSDLLPTILYENNLKYDVVKNGYPLPLLQEDMVRIRTVQKIEYRNYYSPVPKCNGLGMSGFNCYFTYRFNGRNSEIDAEKDLVEEGPITSFWW